MIQYILNITFLILSACGATIIISKGDIFKPFRDWIDKKSIKSKLWVHDISIITNKGNRYVLIDKKQIEPEPILHYLSEIQTLFYTELRKDLIMLNSDKIESGYRMYAKTLNKHSIEIGVYYRVDAIKKIDDYAIANVYEEIKKYKSISFIHQMISCPQCAGVWIGMIWYVIYKLGGLEFPLFIMIGTGCIISLFASLYSKTHNVLAELNSYIEELRKK